MTNLQEILYKHKLWLEKREDGEKADLRGADLQGADLHGTDLRGVDLRGANLQGANLQRIDLHGADLRGSNLQRANLREANLQEANLMWANLRGANLLEIVFNNCIGNGKEIKTLHISRYLISYGFGILNIGCKTYSYHRWRDFTDEEIARMDRGALEWWKEYKPVIMMLIDKEEIER